MFTAMFLASLSLINLLLFPLSSFCSVIQNETDVQSKCDDLDGISKLIEEASKTFTSCMSSISEPSNKEEFYKFVCTDMTQTGYKCLNGLIESGCTNTNLIKRSNLSVRIFNATINEQCEGGKERFMERAPAIEDMSCKPKFVEWSVDIYQKCFPRLSFQVLLPNASVDEIMSFVLGSPSCEYSKIQECIFGILNEACGNRALNVYGFKLMKQGLIQCGINGPDEHRLKNVFAACMGHLVNSPSFSASSFKGNLANPTSSKESFYEFVCVDLPAQFFPYLENLLGKFVHCLETESKFLPKFVLDGFNNSIAQLCTSKDTFIARTEELDRVDCYTKSTGRGSTDRILNVCLMSKTTFLKNGFSIDPEIIITKPLICSELKIVIDCIKKTLDNTCDSNKMTQYILVFLQPFLNSCSKDISENLI